ncbi:MAG TPA: class I SAM-dependent methyltransferase [Acidimicrobiales bacterium]|nr:class I SAM-dependent methyltransferase [Acidimicrobiales bacterium]
MATPSDAPSQPAAPSVAFDRIAARYDDTRGGLDRGRYLGAEIAPHLAPGPVLEIGVGTGAIALPLIELGHPVVGVDLSLPMLRQAQGRLGARVAQADGYHLPVGAGAVANVVVVWVLQLVPDVAGMLAEAARVVAPGGRVVIVPSGGQWDPDPMGDIFMSVAQALRPSRDRPRQLMAAAPGAGLAVVGHHATTPRAQTQSPEQLARLFEGRVWSMLWDVPDDRWAAVVEPAIAALRALPEPDRSRRRVTRDDVVVLSPAGPA